MSQKQLLPNKRYVNAKNINLYIDSELRGEKNIIVPEKTENVFDFLLKFEQERNESYKFCFYGLVESKWGDCNDIRVDFSIKDSSTNLIKNPDTYFWFYDKSSGTSGFTWFTKTMSLDSVDGELSKNIYGKKKGHYFFPFEIDINTLSKTNKSLFVKIDDTIKDLYVIHEFPFLFFDDDGIIVEYGSETAIIQDDGTIIELNNNYPFFYDRHWVRRELEPTGPPFVSFTQSEIIVKEGSDDPFTSVDEIVEIEIELSKPPSGNEKLKIELVYGLDENEKPYTTIQAEQDLNVRLGEITWDSASASTIQKLIINLKDDFYVESTERITFKLTPILGLLPNPDKPQMISIYIEDNDVPSKIAFQSPSTSFSEPRNFNELQIPIKFSLDRKLLVPDQKVTIYIDRDQSDCVADYGFKNPNRPGMNYEDSTILNLNMDDLEYEKILYFKSNPFYDVQRKIVLRMSDFTSNVIQQIFTQGQSVDFTLYVEKDIDKNYVEIHIPFDPDEGKGVLRTAYKRHNSSDGEPRAYRQIYELQTYEHSTIGFLPRNSRIDIANNSPTTPPALKAARQLIFEDSFSIFIINSGVQIIFDNNVYISGGQIIVDAVGYATSVTSGEFYHDGKKFILKILCNSGFLSSTNGSFFGFTQFNGNISIKNNSFNYVDVQEQAKNAFLKTNLIKREIGQFVNPGLATEFLREDLTLIRNNTNNNIVYKLFSEIETSCKTQISYSGNTSFIVSYSGQTIQDSKSKLYYEGAIIVPPDEIQSIGQTLSNYTKVNLFLAPNRIYIDENDFTQGTPANNPNVKNFPVVDYLLDSSVMQYQGPMFLKMGPINVQSGYKIFMPTSPIGGTIKDPFVLGNINYCVMPNPEENKKLFLYGWAQANVNTKNSAIIEIQNTGKIKTNVAGYTLQPNEKVWISESPINTQGLLGTYNKVIPFQNLQEIILFTNDEFRRRIAVSLGSSAPSYKILNKFVRCNYKISFLNFKIYNPDGSFTDKTVNNYIQVNSRVKVFLINPTTAGLLDTTKYLFSVFTNKIAAKTLLSPNNNFQFVCNPNILTVSRIVNKFPDSIVTTNGFIATPSVDAGISFRIADSPIDSDNLGRILYSCSSNGINWQVRET